MKNQMPAKSYRRDAEEQRYENNRHQNAHPGVGKAHRIGGNHAGDGAGGAKRGDERLH